MVDHTQLKEPALWVPERDAELVAAIGKLGEEACETGARIFRCVIQGIEGKDPDDGRSNRDHLRDEIADIEALAQLVKSAYFDTDEDRQHMQKRSAAKYAHKREWLAKLRRHLHEALTQERA